MKKPISVILNVLSIISAVITLILAAFCAYDWFRYSNTEIAYTIEFWLVVDFNSLAMLIFSGAGLILSIPNCFIADSEKSKKTAKILTVAFAAVSVIAVVLYFLPFNF